MSLALFWGSNTLSQRGRYGGEGKRVLTLSPVTSSVVEVNMSTYREMNLTPRIQILHSHFPSYERIFIVFKSPFILRRLSVLAWFKTTPKVFFYVTHSSSIKVSSCRLLRRTSSCSSGKLPYPSLGMNKAIWDCVTSRKMVCAGGQKRVRWKL